MSVCCIFCIVLGVGPGKGGMSYYTHYCTNCNSKVAMKKTLQEDAELYGPKYPSCVFFLCSLLPAFACILPSVLGRVPTYYPPCFSYLQISTSSLLARVDILLAAGTIPVNPLSDLST